MKLRKLLKNITLIVISVIFSLVGGHYLFVAADKNQFVTFLVSLAFFAFSSFAAYLYFKFYYEDNNE